ncbi:MAG: phage tail protein [Myxococcota bacterium]
MENKTHHSSFITHNSAPKEREWLWERLPAWVREQDDGTTQRLLEAFEEQAAAWQERIEQTRSLYDPTSAPAWALDPLLRTWGLDPPGALEQRHKRRLIRWAVPLLQRAGTAPGIEQAVRALTGRDARCLPWNQGWTLDTEHRLDQDADLAASLHRPQDAYAFDLVVRGRFNESQRARIRSVVEMLRPVHCPLRRIAQRPTPPQQATRRLLTRCALGLFRQPQRDNHINAALRAASLPCSNSENGKVERTPSRADGNARAKDDNASEQPPSPPSWKLDPSTGLVLEPTRTDGARASLTTQAAALTSWSKAGKRDLAQALPWGLTRLPFHGAAVQDPATGEAAEPAAMADLVLALAEADKTH